MLSQAQIQRVWEGMLAAEIRALYFADLAARYNARQAKATWATLVLSSGAVVSLLAALPEEYALWVRLALTVTTVIVSAYSLAAQIQKRALEASDLHERWHRVAAEYQAIWENVGALDAFERLQKVDNTVAELSTASHQIPYRERLMRKWQVRVQAEWKQRTAPERRAA